MPELKTTQSQRRASKKYKDSHKELYNTLSLAHYHKNKAIINARRKEKARAKRALEKQMKMKKQVLDQLMQNVL